MIVVDSSAVIAIMLDESDAASFADRLDAADDARISVASVLECLIVLRGKLATATEEVQIRLDQFVEGGDLTVEPVSLEQLAIARTAYQQFGKGTGHGAALNFGDCFSYALAKSLNVPLLYKGGDFAKTDIISAL